MTVFRVDGSKGTPSPTPDPTLTHEPTVTDDPRWKYVDCFEDDGYNRVLGGPRRDSATSMTAQVWW